MGSYVATPFSLSTLLCHEQTDSTFFFQHDENNNLCFPLEDQDEYIEFLFKQESLFASSTTHFLSYHHHHHELRNARLHAIDWIFNVSFLTKLIKNIYIYISLHYFLVLLLLVLKVVVFYHFRHKQNLDSHSKQLIYQSLISTVFSQNDPLM